MLSNHVKSPYSLLHVLKCINTENGSGLLECAHAPKPINQRNSPSWERETQLMRRKHSEEQEKADTKEKAQSVQNPKAVWTSIVASIPSAR